MATQHIQELVENEQGRKIFSVVGNTMLLNQARPGALSLQKIMGLSDYVTGEVMRLEHGEGILALPERNIKLSYRAPKYVPDEWEIVPFKNRRT